MDKSLLAVFMLSVSLYCYFKITKLVSLRRKILPRLRCEYNVPRCYVKCKYFFHSFAINFFRFVTSLNPGIYYLQYYVNDLRYLLPFPAISVTFFSALFHLSSEFLIFFCNCLLHFPIATYKTLALYLCSHRFQKFFRVRFAPERVLRLRNRRNMIVGAAIGRPSS